MENAIARYAATGKPPAPIGNRHPSIVPFESFATQDGQIMVTAGNDTLWQKLCQALDAPQLFADARFTTNPLRNEHYDALRPLLADPFLLKETAVWQNILDDAGIPNGPINTVDKVLQDLQIRAREMAVPVEHPVAGHMELPGIPIKLSATPGVIRHPAPLLGEHTEEVLKMLVADG